MASGAENKSLYVGNLSNKCTEAMLFEKFSSIGSIANLRICKDIAGASLGYAYVNFTKPEEAETALRTLNHELIDEKALRIMWAEKDVKSKLLRSANLVVKNLPKHMGDKLLMDMFSSFGNILSVKVAACSKGISKGYGFVQFENEDSAQKAISAFDGVILHGKKLAVTRFIPAEERQKFHQTAHSNNVDEFEKITDCFGNIVTNEQFEKDVKSKFLRSANLVVKNLPKHMSDMLLMDLFSSFGNILSVKVATFSNGKSKCHGFVQFENEVSAQKAISAVDGVILHGKKLAVTKFIPAEERQKFHQAEYSNKVFVKNLAPSVTNEEFEKLCDCFGNISSAKLATNEDNESKGYGFVSFESNESASRAVEQLNRLCLNGRMLVASIAKAKSPNGKT